MRIIASLLGLVPAVAVFMPSPLGVSTPDISGTYSDCLTASLLPDVPPQEIVIEQSFDGGVNDVVVTPGQGSIINEVSHTFIADGKTRNMYVQEFGVPVGATRMVEFQSVGSENWLVVEQTDDLFGTIVEREIQIRVDDDGELEYNVAFGPFIVYSVRCQLEQ